jgi:hypothetical protein
MMRKLAIMAATVAAAVGLSAHQAKAQTQVTCESMFGRQNVCSMDTRGGVQITRTYSQTPCVEGQTWGLARGGVWVSGGCRATFTNVGVTTGSGRYNNTYNNGVYNNGAYNNNSDLAAADNLCRQAVRSRVGNRRVSTSLQNSNRNNVRIAWQSANGHAGTCRINRNGNVTLNIAR